MSDLDFEQRYQDRYARAKAFSRSLVGPSLVDRLVELPARERSEILADLDATERAALAYSWEAWARPKQRPDLEDRFRILLLLGGRGGGKSIGGAQFIRARVDAGARSIGLIGPTVGDVERWMLGVKEDDEGLLNVFPPNQRPEYIARDEIVQFHTGAVGYVASSERPEFRGPNLDTAWCDEVMKWRYLVPLWDNLEQATRKDVMSRTKPARLLSPRICVTTTPRPRKWLKERIVDPECLTVILATDENPHLDDRWRARMKNLFGGTRQGAEQLDGEILEDSADALFISGILDETRVASAPRGLRTCVSIDPAVTTNKQSDETGIVVAGDDAAGEIYVLADLSGVHEPKKWGELAIGAYLQHDAECFVVEDNRAGQLVEANVRAAMERRRGGIAAEALKVVTVHAHSGRGKYDRAGPVSALHKRRLIHVVGYAMPDLEAELTGWNPKLGGASPNRLDALVWSVWYLGNLAGAEERDYSEGFEGLAAAQRALHQRPRREIGMPEESWADELPRDRFGRGL
jgi:phage terminase large subunit-like protein